jgi:superoxide dismutase, Fe-Mn family
MNDLYTLPALPYAVDALEPWCPAETLQLHHGKHHAAYVLGANEAAAALDVVDPADKAPLAGLQAALAFNLAGHVLHSLFWDNLSGDPTTTDELLGAQIDKDFGSMEHLSDRLTAACMGVQGSGWGALTYDSVSGRLQVSSLHDHQQNLVPNATILAVIDVWEHAYYLGFRNDRASWVAAAIEHLDWSTIAARLEVVLPVLAPAR